MAEGKGDIDIFIFLLVPFFFLCRDVVVLKQQHGIIHIPLQVVHFVLDVELLQVTRAQSENGSFAFVAGDNMSLT